MAFLWENKIAKFALCIFQCGADVRKIGRYQRGPTAGGEAGGAVDTTSGATPRGVHPPRTQCAGASRLLAAEESRVSVQNSILEKNIQQYLCIIYCPVKNLSFR